MTERILFDTLCKVGAKIQNDIDRDTEEARRLAMILMDTEDTFHHNLPSYRDEVAKMRTKLANARLELSRHAGHCSDGCIRTPGQFVGERSTSWRRAPSHAKPDLPPTAELAAMIRDGATIDDLAEQYQRDTSTIRQRLSTAGWSSTTGTAISAAERPLRALARNVLDDQPWRIDAICAQTDPESFYPEKSGSTRDAKAVCASCTVSAECLDYAIDNDERFGIWGGLSERERRQIKKALSQPNLDKETA